MDSEDGDVFIKHLASFVRTHEKALANALQFRRQPARHGASQSVSSIQVPSSPSVPDRPSTSSSTTSALASALSFGALNLTSQSTKSTKLSLTPHHLFYLLSRFEELGIEVGSMKIRLENLHDTSTSANYVSFMGDSQLRRRGSDVASIRSVSSVRSVMSGMSSLWSSFGIGASISAARTERQKAALNMDLKYLYSAFTKIPCLRLGPDWRARLIRGYEEFPFDSAVPLYVFKNVQALEISDIDFRQFYGWDRLSEQLRSLTVKRASLDDPADILIDIVLDDMDKRRRRTSKATQPSPTTAWNANANASPRRIPTSHHTEIHNSKSAPASPDPRKSTADVRINPMSASESAIDEASAFGTSQTTVPLQGDTDEEPKSPGSGGCRPRSFSPVRRPNSRNTSSHARGSSHKIKRSGSSSSHSSQGDPWLHHSRGSSTNLLAMGVLPASKWRFLRHLSLADNSLTTFPATSLAPLSNTLHSLDFSSNLFSEVPDSLSTLTALRALNLSHCMIDSLHSLTRCPLPAITALNLRGNRLQSLAGIEKLYPLERLDLRENRITDPTELARLTGIPDIREIWVDGNPFTRTHRNYRITIFNLFRQTPGYTEDIAIDGYGPTYSEKRLLVDRAPLPEAVPVVKPPQPTIRPVDVSKPTIIHETPREPHVLRKERPSPNMVSSEVNVASSRRRKTPKRRIVDLADTETRVAAVEISPRQAVQNITMKRTPVLDLVDTHVEPEANRSASKPKPSEPQLLPAPVLKPQGEANINIAPDVPPQVHQLPPIPHIDTKVELDLPPAYSAPPDTQVQEDWQVPREWDSGEIYRRKIEALRDRVGNGYLSVLSEESWDGGLAPEYATPTYGPPLRTSATTSPMDSRHHHHHPIGPPLPAIHSGRTLG
ncbi:related to Leucine Rich Repeat domain protein [Cephalotrichum gorgonifer]|uniref:Related to Leucine Rich Repeat domain protein n=1 Tax=Cephalotrichum gorgonifer TaxID=2041049 RepID=A0AAE8SUD8_9PEZI|nr:related to Leucine Rich Repeat domain protein [Cephalotrichum gorgonifer]